LKKDSENGNFISEVFEMAGLYKRGKVYYAMYFVGSKKHRISLQTDSLQFAKEKVRQIESGLARGEDSPLPSRTPIKDVVNAYVDHIRGYKTAKSAQTDVYYLRAMFGAICPALEITSRKVTDKSKKRPAKEGQDKRIAPKVIEANSFEQITTAAISEFISSQVRSRGLAAKTANRYREILMRLFNWAMAEKGVKMPGDKNPVCGASRYKEKAPEIRFLTLAQIDEQLTALQESPQLQVMAAMYIYAGLRREELLWLTLDDIDLKAGGFGMIRVRAKTINGEFWQAKTKVNRAVPISSSLRYYLDRYAPRPSNGRWYFPSPEGKRWDADNFSQDLAAANSKAGLRWGCLDYRHTFGSQLAMKGESLYKISTMMGNSPEICRRHYAAIIPEQIVDSVEFMKPKKQAQSTA
jgi:integrase